MNSSNCNSPSPSWSIYFISSMATPSLRSLLLVLITRFTSSFEMWPLPSTSKVLKTRAKFSFVSRTRWGMQAIMNSLYSIYPDPDMSIKLNIFWISWSSRVFSKYVLKAFSTSSLDSLPSCWPFISQKSLASGFLSSLVSSWQTMYAYVTCFNFWDTLNVFMLARAFWMSLLFSW